MNVADKVVLVTGGAHGIGRALAERFDAEGVDGLAITADVSREEEVRRAVAEAEDRLGAIDLLCSNAGVGYSDAPGWMATSQPNARWEKIWRINVMAHVWGARAVLPQMIARGGGWLLHTSSAAGLLSQIGDASYSTTKHAAIGFAESVAITHGDQGIGVSVLCPQAVDTAMLAAAVGVTAGEAAKVDGVLSPAEVAEAVVRGLEAETFLILPHPEVREYVRRKAADYDRWLAGMRRFRRTMFPDDDMMDFEAR